MTTEEKLKSFILTQYRSLREFTQEIGMPYSTMTTLLKRGVDNSSVTNVIKICQALGISTDDLAEGNIVPINRTMPEAKKIENILNATKQELLNAEKLTFDNEPATEDEVNDIILLIDMAMELQRRKRRMMK